jgi:hypothetical protein
MAEEEFRAIVEDILRPHLTAEELRDIVARWARNRLAILGKYGYPAGEDLAKVERELMEKALRLRERLGLPTPHQSLG